MDGVDSQDPGQDPWEHRPVTEGDWAGWTIYGNEPFEDLTGPFYYRRDEAGQMVCAFKAEQRHLNGGGTMHGGCLMTFADYSLFCIAQGHYDGASAVTVSLNSEFVDAVREGDIVEARGEVVRAGGSLIFIRGMISTSGRSVLSFTAILKKVKRSK